MDKNPYLHGGADEFIENNLGLARHVAWKYAKSRKDCNPDDILSVAYLGLVKAYKGFNPEGRTGIDGKEISFATYATRTIHGFIMTFLRVDRPIRLGRRAIDLIAKMNSAGLIGNETIEEVAIKAGMMIEEANEAVMASIAVNTDSMDREINADNGQGTLADMIGKCDEDNEERVIVESFVNKLSPRFKEIYRLHISEEKSQHEVSEIMGLSQSYISRLTTQLMEMAKQYGEMEGLRIPEGVETDMSKKTDRMKNSITTIEQFYSAGGVTSIADKYGVSIPTVYALRKKLTEKMDGGIEMSVIKADEVKMETTPYSVNDISRSRELANTSPEGRQAPSEQSNATAVDDCTIDDIDRLKTCADSFDDGNKGDEIEGGDVGGETNRVSGCFGEYDARYYSCSNGCKDADECHEKTCVLAHQEKAGVSDETIDDLEGLAEPEPEWEHDQIKRKWTNIETELSLISMLYKERAMEEFNVKLNEIIGGMTNV